MVQEFAAAEMAYNTRCEAAEAVVARESAPRIRFEAMTRPGGIYLGHHPTMPIDGEQVQAAFNYMVRGLYFKLRKKRIPYDYRFEIRRVDRFHPRRGGFRRGEACGDETRG